MLLAVSHPHYRHQQVPLQTITRSIGIVATFLIIDTTQFATAHSASCRMSTHPSQMPPPTSPCSSRSLATAVLCVLRLCTDSSRLELTSPCCVHAVFVTAICLTIVQTAPVCCCAAQFSITTAECQHGHHQCCPGSVARRNLYLLIQLWLFFACGDCML